MKVLVKNGHKKVITTGFSWTSLFFGVLVPLIRADLAGFLIQCSLGFFTMGLSWIIIPFTYNDSYENRLKADGWEVASVGYSS